MIKVLSKTLAVLEALAIASPYPRRISELAEEFGINTATCARILRELVDAGYAVQISRQDGYAAGPRAWTFACQIRYRERLIHAAAPIIEQTAQEMEASVLLTERQGTERYILLHENCCRKLDIQLEQLSYRDLFSTATGLMLTACAPAEEQEELIAAYPGETGLLLEESHLREQLNAIRRARECSFRKNDQGIAACPIFRNRTPVAVLGGSVAVEDFVDPYRKKFLAALRHAAEIISKSISITNTIG